MPTKTPSKPKAPPKPALPAPGPERPVALPLAWDGDRLLITDPDAVAKIARKRLSPSTAKSMHSCGARYAAEKLMRGQEDPFAPAPFGTSVHQVLENFYKMPMPQRTRSALEEHVRKVLAESAVPHGAASWPGIDRARHDEWLQLITANASRIFEIEDPTTVQVRALEMNLDTVELEGVPFVGFIDRVDITGDGRTFGSGIVDYKGLAVDTPIPTPSGWTTMGALGEGDFVFGSDGRSTRVTHKSSVHHRPCYRLTFSDGSAVVCDNVHMWTVRTANKRAGETITLSSDDLYALHGASLKAGRTKAVTIANTLPIDLPTADLPIDPWILGVWLGDGKSTSGGVTIGLQDSDEMIQLLRARWQTVSIEPGTLRKGSALTVSLGRNGPEYNVEKVVKTKKVVVSNSVDRSLCPHNHDLLGDERPWRPCITCREITSEVLAAALSHLPKTNERPEPMNCPYGHSTEGRPMGARCKTCAMLRGRVDRGTASDQGVKYNVRPNPSRCVYDHECGLTTPKSGDIKCPTCSSIRADALTVALGPATNISGRTFSVKTWTVERRSRTDATRADRSLMTKLTALGLTGNKHVPAIYLRGSISQRLGLLQGLMDTDGHWNPKRKRAVFVNTNAHLVDSVAELVLSLGVTAQRFAKPYKNKKRKDQTAYIVEFRPVGFNPFLLPRKANAVDATQKCGVYSTARATRRIITAMDPIESVPTQCITVDAPDALYLCGRTLVPTHNSGKQPNAWSVKSEDAHGDQLRTYVAALTELDGVKPLSAHLHYTATGKTREVPIGPRLVAKTVAGFVESWAILNKYVAESAFATQVSALCGWCPLVNSCPVAAREDKVARIDGLPTAVQLGIPTFRPLADLVTVDVDFDLDDPDYIPPEPPSWMPSDPGYPDADEIATMVEPSATDDPTEEDLDAELVLAVAGSDTASADSADPELAAVAAAAAASVGDTDLPAHVPSNHQTPAGPADREEIDMTEKRKLYEDKPYDETANQDLNPNSYAATAAFDLTEKAKEALLNAGVPLTASRLSALAGTYYFIVGRVQESFTGKTSLQDGMNSRLRYLLSRHLFTDPAPLGGDADEWQAWIAASIKRIESIAKTAIALWDNGFPQEDVYGPLVGIKLPVKQLKAV